MSAAAMMTCGCGTRRARSRHVGATPRGCRKTSTGSRGRFSPPSLVPPPLCEATFAWVLCPVGGRLEADWTIYTDGSCLDGPTPLLRRTGWAFVAMDGDGVIRASANGVPPQWIGTIFGAETWAILQAVTHALGSPVLRTDCKSALDVLCAGRERAVDAGRLTARAWAAIFAATDGLPLGDAAWMPAHTVAADVGQRRLSNGELLSARDRRGNDAADALAKEAVDLHRVPAGIRKAVSDQEEEVTAMAWWVARVTLSANAWGPQALRDSTSAPRGRRRGPAGAARTRRLREEIPVALGGHDVTCAWPHLARPWQCRCCHRTAARRSALCYTRCPGSAVRRWARSTAAAAATGEGAGGGHYLLLTGNVVWCWRCGANACVRAHNLAKQCPGRAGGFLVHARQRLLLGLHPTSRVPLDAATAPEPGWALPVGFDRAVQAAASSATAAARTRRKPVGGVAAPRAACFVSPRLEALRDRVRARVATVGAAAAEPVPAAKRRRLWGKQPPGAAIAR